MPTEIDGKTFYRTQEACEKAGVSRATLFRWLRTGVILDVEHKDRRGWRLFSEKDIKRLRKEAKAVREEHLQKYRMTQVPLDTWRNLKLLSDVTQRPMTELIGLAVTEYAASGHWTTLPKRKTLRRPRQK